MKPLEYHVMHGVEDRFWWYLGLRHILRLSFQRYCGHDGLRILDAGCGTGANLKLLSSMVSGSLSAGFDYSHIATELATQRGLPHVLQADIQKIPFASDCFDACVSFDVLSHRNVDSTIAIKEIHRVLKPGGHFFLNLPAFGWLRGNHDRAVHMDRRFNPRELRALLGENGFRIELITCWNFGLLPLLFARRFLQRIGRPNEEDCESDLSEPPAWINQLLHSWILIENSIALRLRFPVGSSVFAVASKRSLSTIP